MKVTYRGGFNKKNKKSTQSGVLYAYADQVKQFIKDGKKIAVVTYAKDDGYFDATIKKQFGTKVDIIDSKAQPKWETYDYIFLLGGNQEQLKEMLIKKGFSLENLHNDVHIIGDSAGAMVMSTYFYHITDEDVVYFHQGLHPESKQLTIVHADNPHYAPEKKMKEIASFGKKLGLNVVELKENEEFTV